jgi:WD40 repeat protein
VPIGASPSPWAVDLRPRHTMPKAVEPIQLNPSSVSSSSTLKTSSMTVAPPRADSAPQNAVTSVAFRPDGRSLAVTSSTGDLVLWDVNLADWTADACALAGGALTRAEWSQFVGPSEPYQPACG